MPYAITHVLFAVVAAELIRDYAFKKRFSFIYVILAGIAGMIPDIDVLFVLLSGLPISDAIQGRATYLHPSFTHSILWIPIVLALAFFILNLEKKGKMGIQILEKYKLKMSGILFIMALGITMHLALDSTLTGFLRIGFFTKPIGLNLVPFSQFGSMIIGSIDALFLVLWLIHEGIRHKPAKIM
ncbi:MAG: metal-dependent hydrolase [archaeon]